MNVIYVAAGGAIGSVLRYGVGVLMTKCCGTAFAYGTLTVNVLGSLAMGVLVGWLLRTPDVHPMLHPLLAVGVLGGFTTFSTFSLDVVQLWQRGDMVPAMLYVAASIIISVGALIVGLMMMQGKAL